jgi:hypothetical protein
LALTNGNYVVRSPLWDNGSVQDAGAVTLGNGMSGATGSVSITNSLVGSTAGDQVGLGQGIFGALALANGNYVIASPLWDDGDIADVGAVTFGDGQTGVVGPINASKSLVGSTAGDQLGGGGSGFVFHLAGLPNGNYVVGSPNWDSGDIADVGAVTLCNGVSGTSGTVSSGNSLVGSHAADQISYTTQGFGLRIDLSSGNFLVTSAFWDNGDLVDAGAVTFGDASMGVIGPINSTNSAIGGTANSSLLSVIVDNLNQTFYVRFLADGGGRVAVGSQIDGFAHHWHLAAKPLDVDNDTHVAANDVVAIVNYINAGFPSKVAADATIGGPYGFLDVNGDDFVAANDALAVINAINAGMGGEGEQTSVEPGVQNAESGQPGAGGQLSAASGVDAALMMWLAIDGGVQTRRRM